MKIGEIVEVNGEKRVITRIEGDMYFSTPLKEDIKEATVEITHVEKETKSEAKDEKVVKRRIKK